MPRATSVVILEALDDGVALALEMSARVDGISIKDAIQTAVLAYVRERQLDHADRETLRTRLPPGRRSKGPADSAEARTAHHAVHLAIADGTLIRPDVCEICGETPSPVIVYGGGGQYYGTGIVAHHHLGYTDHALDVQWLLCRRCHSRVHCMPAREALQRTRRARRAVLDQVEEELTNVPAI